VTSFKIQSTEKAEITTKAGNKIPVALDEGLATEYQGDFAVDHALIVDLMKTFTANNINHDSVAEIKLKNNDQGAIDVKVIGKDGSQQTFPLEGTGVSEPLMQL